MRKARDDVVSKRDTESEDEGVGAQELKQSRVAQQKAKAVDDYKRDYLKYFEMKIQRNAGG